MTKTRDLTAREAGSVIQEKEAEGSFLERKSGALLHLALIVGAALLVYPSAADYWNSFHQSRAVATYAEQVANMNEDQYTEEIASAREYNEALSGTGIQWIMEEENLRRYETLLDPGGTGVMGYVDVPKINVKLPIYHGTSQEVLQIAIGHLEQTSLPVGGSGSHCALSGHRGLPSAKLFSDLDKLVEGDTFTISVMNETLTYQVDRVRVVVPADMSDLAIEPGEDLCTLVTCTPYGINTHRLLVRGHRIENLQGDAKVVADALQLEPAFVTPFLMIPFVIVFLILVFLKT